LQPNTPVQYLHIFSETRNFLIKFKINFVCALADPFLTDHDVSALEPEETNKSLFEETQEEY